MDVLSPQPSSTFWQVQHWQGAFDELSSRASLFILFNRTLMIGFWQINEKREDKRDGCKIVFIIHLYIQKRGRCADAKQGCLAWNALSVLSSWSRVRPAWLSIPAQLLHPGNRAPIILHCQPVLRPSQFQAERLSKALAQHSTIQLCTWIVK